MYNIPVKININSRFGIVFILIESNDEMIKPHIIKVKRKIVKEELKMPSSAFIIDSFGTIHTIRIISARNLTKKEIKEFNRRWVR